MANNFKLVFVMFLWAICFPLITIGISYAPHLTFAALRALLSGAVLLALALFLRRTMPCRFKDWGAILVIALGATTMAFFGMFHAAEFVAPGVATVIASTQPLMAALLAHWFLGERLSSKGHIGLVLGFLGIVLIAAPQLFANGSYAFTFGTTFILLSALGITISNVIIKHIASRIDPLVAMGWQLLIGSIPLAALAIATEDIDSIQWTVEFLISLFGLSFFGTALVYWIWTRVLRDVELSHANAFTFLVPVFGVGMGVAFYQERFPGVALIGVALILLEIHQVTTGDRLKIGGKLPH